MLPLPSQMDSPSFLTLSSQVVVFLEGFLFSFHKGNQRASL